MTDATDRSFNSYSWGWSDDGRLGLVLEPEEDSVYEPDDDTLQPKPGDGAAEELGAVDDDGAAEEADSDDDSEEGDGAAEASIDNSAEIKPPSMFRETLHGKIKQKVRYMRPSHAG